MRYCLIKAIYTILLITSFTSLVPLVQAAGCGTSFSSTESPLPTCECRNPSGNIQVELLSSTVICCGWKDQTESDQCSDTNPASTSVGCGDTFSPPNSCGCLNSSNQTQQMMMDNGQMCCGWFDTSRGDDNCLPSVPSTIDYSCGETVTIPENSYPFAKCACLADWHLVSTDPSSGSTYMCVAGAYACGDEMTETPATCNCPDSAGNPNHTEVQGSTKCCGWIDQRFPDECRPMPTKTEEVGCGIPFDPSTQSCNCPDAPSNAQTGTSVCCGWPNDTEADGCGASDPTRCGVIPSNATIGGKPGTDFCELSPGQVYALGSPAVACTSRTAGEPCCASTDACTELTGQPPTDGGGTGGGDDTPDPAPDPDDSAEEGEEEVGDSGLNIFDAPNSATFATLNPLRIAQSPFADQFSSPAGILNRALLFIFPISGLVLFVMLVWGGFEIIRNANNQKAIQAGKERITAALLGIGLLFGSFWIMQIVQYVFGLAIL